MHKRKVVKEYWTVEVPAIYAMGAMTVLEYAIDAAAIFEAIQCLPPTKSFDGAVLIHCHDEDQCDRILAAAEWSKDAKNSG